MAEKIEKTEKPKTKILTKSNIWKTIFILWIAGTSVYFFYDMWSDFKLMGLDRAYQGGRMDTINQLIEQTQKSNCQPFEVFSGDKKVQLVDAQCGGQNVSAPVDEKNKQ